MIHLCIVGSGPAGYYTAEAAAKKWGDGVRVDIIDRLPVPYGLIRSGVAPDHQSIKAVAKRYEAVNEADNVRFVGNVSVGTDAGGVTIAELGALYDAVVLATGAPADKPLGVPGDDLPGVVGSAAFVGWYNGHSDHAELEPALHPASGAGQAAHAVVVGNGNVALDVARILAKTRDEFAGSDIAGHALAALEGLAIRRITILGRRGPQQIAMTPKELGELGQLADARPIVEAGDLPPPESDAGLEPGLRKSVAHLRSFAAMDAQAKRKEIVFDFFAMPVAIEGRSTGSGQGRVERVVVERTRLDGDPSTGSGQAKAVPTGERYAIPASLVVACIGYRTPPIAGVPYDEALGRFANVEGRIAPRLYCVGWARRGPTGTIGTNRPDGYAIVELVAEDVALRQAQGDRGGGPSTGSGRGRAGLDALLAARGADPVTFRDWRRIEAAEIARAREGSPREKFTDVGAMLAARG